MHTPESYYFGALKRALEGDLEGALSLHERAEEAREAYGYNFSEAVSDDFPFVEEAVTTLLSSFDFTRCVRPDGSAYGTRGKCRKGSQQEKEPSSAKTKAPRSGGEAASPAMIKTRVNSTVSSIVKEIKKEGLWHRGLTQGEEEGIRREVLEALKEHKIEKHGMPSVSELKESYWGRQTDADGVFRGAIPGVDTED